MAKKFNNFMLSGKVNAVLRPLSDTESAGILSTNIQTIDLLQNTMTIYYTARKNYMKNMHTK